MANTKAYKISHYARLSVSQGGWNQLEEWMRARNVAFDNTVFSVDVADARLTPAHYEAIKAGDDENFDLDVLVSNMFDEEEPDWIGNGESLGNFEMEFRIGMGPLHKWCAEAGVDEQELQDLLEEICEGAGMTDSTWIEDEADFE